MARSLPKHVICDRDRHGVERLYFRRDRTRGTPKIFLGYDPELPAFWDAYAAAVRGDAPPAALYRRQPAQAAANKKQTHGTFRQLVADYFEDKFAFEGLDEKQTKGRAKRILEECCREPIAPGSSLFLADTPLAEFGPDHVAMLIERKKRTGAKAAANQRHKDLKRMFKWALKSSYTVNGKPMKLNPVLSVDTVKYTTEGHHTWTLDEVARFEKAHPVGSKARLALGLYIYLGQRIGDVWQLGRQHERAGVLVFTQDKNHARNPVRMELPVLPPLRRIIDASPTGDLAYLVNDYGQPFASAKSFANKFKDWCDKAGLPGHCTSHGLRKAAACMAAENGATEAEMMAIFGWRDTRMAALYIQKANKKRLAHNSMHKLIDAAYAGEVATAAER